MSIAIDAGDSEYDFVGAFGFWDGQKDGLSIVSSCISVDDDIVTVGEGELSFWYFLSDLHIDFDYILWDMVW